MHLVFIAYDGEFQTTKVTVDKFEFLVSLNFSDQTWGSGLAWGCSS